MDSRPASHYDALQLTPDASADDVRQAYRRLAQQHHPDRQEGADGSAMARINQAYQVLSDAHRRAEYDFNLRVAAMREARSRLPRSSRLSTTPWLMLWAVISLTVLVLGWVAYRSLVPQAVVLPRTAAPSQGPLPDDPLPLIPARRIEAWTPPPPSQRPVNAQTEPVHRLVRDGVMPSAPARKTQGAPAQ